MGNDIKGGMLLFDERFSEAYGKEGWEGIGYPNELGMGLGDTEQ